MLPEFGESAEDGCLGDLFAELGGEVGCGEADGLVGKEGVGVECERGNFGRAAGGGRLLPGLVAAKGEDVGEGERGDEEVWRLGADAGGTAEKIQGMAPLSRMRRERRLRDCSISAKVGAGLGAPRVASTKDGAGAGSCAARGVKRTRPEVLSQSRSMLMVRMGSAL